VDRVRPVVDLARKEMVGAIPVPVAPVAVNAVLVEAKAARSAQETAAQDGPWEAVVPTVATVAASDATFVRPRWSK